MGVSHVFAVQVSDAVLDACLQVRDWWLVRKLKAHGVDPYFKYSITWNPLRGGGPFSRSCFQISWMEPYLQVWKMTFPIERG